MRSHKTLVNTGPHTSPTEYTGTKNFLHDIYFASFKLKRTFNISCSLRTLEFLRNTRGLLKAGKETVRLDDVFPLLSLGHRITNLNNSSSFL